MYYGYPVAYAYPGYSGAYPSAYFQDRQFVYAPAVYSAIPYAYWHGWAEGYRQELKDHGSNPFVLNIEQASKQNETYRTAIWTGKHLQVTVMSINVGDDIGLEVHPSTDQFLRVEDGQGYVQMGAAKDRLDFTANVQEGDAIMVPAGTWHNVTNTGSIPLKVYSIYAPPEHPFGTVEAVKPEVP